MLAAWWAPAHLGSEHVSDPVHRPLQHQTPDQEAEEHHVGKQRAEVHHLQERKVNAVSNGKRVASSSLFFPLPSQRRRCL